MPLPARLAALRQTHRNEPDALRQLAAYDAASGETHVAWPKDVASLLQRADGCNASAGEFNGDGSQGDRDTQPQMERLHCGSLVKQIGALRQNYRDDPRVATRLASFDGQGLPMPPLPAEVRSFGEASQRCAAGSASTKPDCAYLAKRLHELKARYKNGADFVASNTGEWLVPLDDATGRPPRPELDIDGAITTPCEAPSAQQAVHRFSIARVVPCWTPSSGAWLRPLLPVLGTLATGTLNSSCRRALSPTRT